MSPKADVLKKTKLQKNSFHNIGLKVSNFLMTTIPMTLLTGICVGIGAAFGGVGSMLVALGFATALNFTVYYFSSNIVLSLYQAKDIELKDAKQKALDDVVTELSNEYGLPKPKVNVVEKSYLNAFATGRNPENAAVVATLGLLNRLVLDKKFDDQVLPNADFFTKKEIKAIFAHELGHVTNYDTLLSTVVATLTGAIGILADMIRASVLNNGEDTSFTFRFVSYFAASLLPTVATLLQCTISRSRESQADCTGAEIMGEGESLASALKKITRFSNETTCNYEKKHGYPESEMGLISATSFLLFSEPNLNETNGYNTQLNSAFDVQELYDPNDNFFTWALSWFASHPSTITRVGDLEKIHENISKKTTPVMI